MKILIVSLLFVITSCSHVASLSQTSIPKRKGKVVRAEVTNNVILLLNFSNAYVDEISSKLSGQCPKGNVQGILTKHENITYFPIIFHQVKVTAEGYCNG